MSYGPLTEEQAEILRNKNRETFSKVYLIQDALKDAMLEDLINLLKNKNEKVCYNNFVEYCEDDPEAYRLFCKTLNDII